MYHSIISLNMKNFYILLLILIPAVVFGNSNEEAASTSTRGKYLSENGNIIPPSEVRINSYISHVDYSYPQPNEGIGITFETGQNILSTDENEIFIQIGLQGKYTEFENLKPINLVFIVDATGSMAQNDKINWAKKGLEKVINRLRASDTVSILVVSKSTYILQEPVILKSEKVKKDIISKIKKIQPYGSNSLDESFSLSGELIEKRYSKDGINRVLLLSDGKDIAPDLEKPPVTFKSEGINITAIGFGMDFNVNGMIQLAKLTGGSSRFISDMEEMDKVFSSELDRTIVPVARDIKITLELPDFISDIETWGYKNSIKNNTITYSQPTIHNGDYETILVRCRSKDVKKIGNNRIGSLKVTYKNLSGKDIKPDKQNIEATFKNIKPVSNISNPYIIKSSTMLKLGETLKEMGTLNEEAEAFRYPVTTYSYIDAENLKDITKDFPHENLLEEQRRIDKLSDKLYKQRLLGLNHYAMLTLFYTSRIFGEELFTDEEEIVSNYFNILRYSVNESILEKYYKNNFNERSLSNSMNSDIVLFTDELLHDIPENANVILKGDDLFKYSEKKVNLIGISSDYSTLIDDYTINNSILLGKLTKADYIVSTSEKEINDAVIVTGRLIDLKTGQIVSGLNMLKSKSNE